MSQQRHNFHPFQSDKLILQCLDLSVIETHSVCNRRRMAIAVLDHFLGLKMASIFHRNLQTSRDVPASKEK